MANVVRPTLGPTPRRVLMADTASGSRPEILDDAATIIRRIVELPDPYANMGAMLLRHAVWRTSEAVGDGAATTAILFQAIMHHASAYVASGGNPVALRKGLEQGLTIATAALRDLAMPVHGQANIARVADALCHDLKIATLLGEVFDIVGTDGYVQVEDGHTEDVHRRYVEGACWDEGYLSPYFVTDPHTQTSRLDTPAVLISDLRLTEAEEVTPLLDRLVSTGQRHLLIIAHEVSGNALGTLVVNHQRGLVRLLVVKAPSHGLSRINILEDIASFTGGRVVTEATGSQIDAVTLADLGHTRAAWASMTTFGVQGGQGDPGGLRRRIAQIKGEYARTTTPIVREELRERLSKLMGGVAILEVGGTTVTHREARKTATCRAIQALREALRGGVAPGGGIAYLACVPSLRTAQASGDERVALDILASALAEPLRAIARNAGADPTATVARVAASQQGWGFDARTGEIVDMWSVGIMDAAPVLQTALESAVSGAIMTLTADVLVHQRAPLMVATP